MRVGDVVFLNGDLECRRLTVLEVCCCQVDQVLVGWFCDGVFITAPIPHDALTVVE